MTFFCCFFFQTPLMESNTTSPLFPGNNSHTISTCSRDNVLKTVVFPVLYSFLFIMGLLLNSVAVWVFFRIPSKSHFIIYLKNIVVADVIMTFTFPFKVCFNRYRLLMRHTLTVKNNFYFNTNLIFTKLIYHFLLICRTLRTPRNHSYSRH